MRLWSAYAHAVVREMVRACRSFCRWRDGSNIAKGFATLRRILNIRAGRKSLKTYFQAWKEVFTLEKQIRYTQRRESRCKQKKETSVLGGQEGGEKGTKAAARTTDRAPDPLRDVPKDISSLGADLSIP